MNQASLHAETRQQALGKPPQKGPQEKCIRFWREEEHPALEEGSLGSKGYTTMRSQAKAQDS